MAARWRHGNLAIDPDQLADRSALRHERHHAIGGAAESRFMIAALSEKLRPGAGIGPVLRDHAEGHQVHARDWIVRRSGLPGCWTA